VNALSMAPQVGRSVLTELGPLSDSGKYDLTGLMSARAARLMLPVGLLAAGSGFAFNRFRNHDSVNSQRDTRWDFGLKRTPSYVPLWRRPASVIEGKVEGLIPKDALAFETGQDGGRFASLTNWMDACNAADVPGAIETSIEVADLPRRYLARGLYGAGPNDVKIKWTGRKVSANHCWLHAMLNDVTIRGIDFDGFNCVVGLTYPTLPLRTDGGREVDDAPYHTATEPVYLALNANAGGAAADFRCHRLGRIAPSSPFRIRRISLVRQIARTTRRADKTNNNYFDDVTWQAVLERVSIIRDADISSIEMLLHHLNARAAVMGYVAERDGKGGVTVRSASIETPAIVEIIVDGDGDINVDVRSPSIDVSHCRFTDTNVGIAAVLDVMELGPITFCKNDMPGTWSGVAAFVTRWTDIFFANNHWHDCWDDRPAGIGRSSSKLPAGHSMTAFNTACYIGCNSPVMMRYHNNGNSVMVENNHVENVESDNQTNTVNSAVLADIRNGWQCTGNQKRISLSYNYVKHLIARGKSQDCNVFYGKLRGCSMIGNYLADFGIHDDPSNQNGRAEAAGALFKNPGPYNGTIDGSLPEPTIICGNQVIDGPAGLPWVKVDDVGAAVIIEHNKFENWGVLPAGTRPEEGRNAGLLRMTDNQIAIKISSNSFENIIIRPGQRYFLINLWNLKSNTGEFDLSNFEFSGNVVEVGRNSTYAAGENLPALVTFRFDNAKPDDPVRDFSHVKTGGNYLRQDKKVIKMPMSLWYDNGQKVYRGSERETGITYDTDYYLTRYNIIAQN